MDYSNVTTADLQAHIYALAERQIELGWERERVAKQIDQAYAELVRRRIGTTDDRVSWQEVGIR